MKNTARTPLMDLLRFGACLMVLSRHWLSQEWNLLEIYASTFNNRPTSINFIQTFFDLGFLGVDIFFIISGAIIVRTVLNHDKRTFRIGISEFTISRFFRLAPVYFATLLPSIVIGRHIFDKSEYFSMKSIYGSLTLSNYGYSLPAPNGQSWTLFVEVKFYFLIALLLYFSKKFNNNDRKTLFIFLAVWLVYYISTLTLNPTFLDSILISDFAPYFITGAFLGLLRHRRDLLTLLPVLALTTSLCLFVSNERIVNETGSSNLSFIGSIIIIFAVVTLMLDNLVEFHRSIPITELFGRVTYPLYMLHMVIGTGIIKFTIYLGIPFSVSLLSTLAILIGISIMYLYLIEDTYIKVLRRKSNSAITKLAT